MNKKNIPLLILVLILFTGVLGIFRFRIDLTSEKRYTLSDATIEILKSIKEPIAVDVYLEGDFPASFKRLQTETRFLLEEFRRINPKINFTFIDPIKEKISQENLEAMGMQPSILPNIKDGKISEIVLFPYAVIKHQGKGISTSLIIEKQNIKPSEQLNKSIESLEYNMIANISSIISTKKKNIGILVNQDELRPNEFRSFMEMALEHYNAFPIIPKNQIELTKEDIPNLNRTQALVIAKPRKAFTDGEKVILDQYIMNGGRTLWMIDAVNAEMDTLTLKKKIMAYPIDLNMTDFFFNYGIRINPALVKDVKKFALLRLVTGEVAGNPQYMSLPWPYFTLGIDEYNNPITKNLNPVKLEFPTSIDTLGHPNIKTSVLFQSSEKTLQKQVPNYVDLKEIATVDSLGQNEKSVTPKIYAVSLEGKFSSAYATRSERHLFPNFKAQSPENKMIIIADGDVGRNGIVQGEVLPLGVDLLTNQRFGNEEFLRNSLNFLLDDNNLIALRNRNIEERLLDRDKIREEKTLWQWFNLLFPLVFIAVASGIFYWIKIRQFRH